MFGVRLGSIVLASLLLASAPAAPANVGNATVHVLFVTDIHFDPFADKELVDRLAVAPPSQWYAIFASVRTASVNGYGKDTDDSLLESAFSAMGAIRPRPSIVLVDGDFLAHRFHALFAEAASDKSDEAYDRFVDKTIAFLALRLSRTFPGARILPAIGNNDSYCGDYRLEPSSPFLAHMATVFGPLVNARDGAEFVRPFSEGGHYTLDLPAAGLRLIVPNSVFWSTEYKDECDPSSTPAAQREFDWFRAQLARPVPAGEHVWIATHIPPGIDVFSSLHVTAPKPTYVAPFEGEVPAAIAGARTPVATFVAGHFHFAGFRLIPARGGEVPIVDLPAVSPIYGDAPAFVAAELSPRSGLIDDYTTYAASGLSVFAVAPDRVAWGIDYRFSSSYGVHGVDGATVAAVEQRVLTEPDLRKRYFENFASGSPMGAMMALTWHDYWCGSVALAAQAYTACLGQGATPGRR